ncbi:Vacuolar sorting protein 39 [Glycine max]|nr:Vacuolar sorting protein 39 [Glycine max]
MEKKNKDFLNRLECEQSSSLRVNGICLENVGRRHNCNEFNFLQFSIKLADKQAALEKIQWEAMTSNKKVDKLQDEVGSMQVDITSFTLLLEGLSKTDTAKYTDDYDVKPYDFSHLPSIPLCGTNPIIVLKFSMLVLESCPSQTIDLFLSGNIPTDMVSSYLKKHSPNMQARYLELMLAMNENAVFRNLHNEMVHIYLSESIARYNPEALLKHLPLDALYEECAILLGKMNQHDLALSLYVHKLNALELALSYCDRVYECMHQPSSKNSNNIYLVLLQIYLNPRRTIAGFENIIKNLLSPQNKTIPKLTPTPSIKSRGQGLKKIVAIEGAKDTKVSLSSTDNGRSHGDADEYNEGGSTIMLDEVVDLLSHRWDRINGAQALKLLPKETKLQKCVYNLQDLLSFLGPLLRKSNEMYRNCSVIKSLRQSENLHGAFVELRLLWRLKNLSLLSGFIVHHHDSVPSSTCTVGCNMAEPMSHTFAYSDTSHDSICFEHVKDKLYSQRKAIVKITGDSMCSLCHKKIGTSVFAVYPNGSTLVHFVCLRDSQNMKAVGKGSQLRKQL